MSFRRRMRGLPIGQIRVTDPFWTRWQQVLAEVTLPGQYEQIVRTGRLANFRRAAKLEEGPHEGYYYNDSDVYKWLEACGYALAHYSNPSLQAMVEEVIDAVAKAQEPSGYINTFFQLSHPNLKFRNLSMMHELYCGGHLVEAGVGFYEGTGDRRLLDVAIKFANHVASIFGPGKRVGFGGHQGLELALVRLSEATSDPRYRELARWMVEERGKRPSPFAAELADEEAMKLSPWAKKHLTRNGEYQGEYVQDHLPIRQHTEIVGHAVRSMYFYTAATLLADGQEDAEMEGALTGIWNNLTKRRMYVTGGIGTSGSNEGFTTDYDLPNLTSYAETCAACGLVWWGQSLLEMTGESEFADILELALYNGALAGIALAGDCFFYDNPLESRGGHERQPWFDCACCPPNIARLIGSVGRHAIEVSEDALYLHIPIGLETTATFGGVPVGVKIEGDYPWSGNFTVRIDPEKEVEFDLKVRIPNWAEEVETELPGLERQADFEAGYAVFHKRWHKGDVLTVDLGMQPKWLEADPRVRDNLGRVALTRGPLIYAAEQPDLGFAPQLFAVDTQVDIQFTKEKMLEGVTSIAIGGQVDEEPFVDDLYAETGTIESKETSAKLIPYFAWNNRGPGNMQVWLRQV